MVDNRITLPTPSSHLPDGCERVLRCVVPTAPVSDHRHLAAARGPPGRVQHLPGPAGGHLREPEEHHEEVEGGYEAGGPQWAASPQQQDREGDRVEDGFVPRLQHGGAPFSRAALVKSHSIP